MDLRLQIYRDPVGTWSIEGLPSPSVGEFKDLSESLEYAKRECASAPAEIELFIDGFYLFVYQERGWPHQLCRPAGYRRTGIGGAVRRAGASTFARISNRLRGCADSLGIWHLLSICRGTRASRALVGKASVFRAAPAPKS